MSKDGNGSNVPRIFTHGVGKIFDNTKQPEVPKHEKKATSAPDHQPRPKGPGADAVITQNMHTQHTASPDYKPHTPTKEPPKLPNHEQSLELSGGRGPGYAGQSFRQATRPNGRPR